MGRTSLVADLEVVGGAMLPAEARLRAHVAIRRLSGAALESGRVEFAELVDQVHLPCLRVSPAHSGQARFTSPAFACRLLTPRQV